MIDARALAECLMVMAHMEKTTMNDKFWNEVKECHEYLDTGGLGEVQGIVQMYADMGHEKVQNDTALEWAILELAAEGLNARRNLPTATTGPDKLDG